MRRCSVQTNANAVQGFADRTLKIHAVPSFISHMELALHLLHGTCTKKAELLLVRVIISHLLFSPSLIV